MAEPGTVPVFRGGLKAGGAVLLFALTMLSAAVQTAADDHFQCPEMVGRWSWGASSTVVASEDFIYFDSQHGLLVADISTSKAPRIVGEVTLGDEGLSPVQDLALEGGRVYALTYHVLSVINVEDPTAPLEEGLVRISEPGQSAHMSVTASGSYAFVAQAGTGLRIFDIDGPASPAEVGFLAMPVSACVAMDGNHVFVGGHSGLHVIDVSSPTAPVEVGFAPMSISPDELVVENGYAYGVSSFNAMAVVDIRVPSAPVEVGSFNVSGFVTGIAVCNSRAYLATFSHGLRVIDVSDPTAPVEIGSIEDTGVAWGVAAQGDHVFLATDRFGLRVFNVEIPLYIFEVSSLDIDGVQDVAVTGTYAYVAAHEMGLRVIDLSDPNAPSQIGSVVIPWARTVAIDSGYAFVGTLEDGLWVVDISIPDAPKILGSMALPGTVNDVAVSGTYAYVAVRENGLRVIDVSNPTQPYEVGWLPIDPANKIVISGDFAYLVAGVQGLLILDLTNPVLPIQVNAVHRLAFAVDFALSGGYAYVIFGNDYWFDYTWNYDVELSSFALADPWSLVELATVPLNWESWSVGIFEGGVPPKLTVGQNHAYVGGTTLAAIDIANPWDPRVIEPCELSWLGNGVAMAEGHFLLADGAGIAVYRNPDNVLFRDGFETGDTSRW